MLFKHRLFAPVIIGFAFIVTVVLALQPKLLVYVIETVPAETPVTTPSDETVAKLLFELDQLAVVPEPVNVMVLLTQTALGPVMVGIGFTDMLIVFEHPVLVTYVIVAFPTEIPET